MHLFIISTVCESPFSYKNVSVNWRFALKVKTGDYLLVFKGVCDANTDIHAVFFSVKADAVFYSLVSHRNTSNDRELFI